MKNRLYLLSVCLMFCAAIYAAPVDPMRALQVAQEFVPVKATPQHKAKGQTPTPASQIVYTHYMLKSGKPAIYVVNISDAFAIVSADDVAHPILGYNYSKAWPTDGNLPPQVKSFFDDLAQQMEAAAEHPRDTEMADEWQNPRKAPSRAKANNNLPDSVGPLLTTTWNQGQYYNALCPADGQGPDGHVYTGCVATAMAQIINYWGQQQTIHTRGKHSYNSNYGTLEVDFGNNTYDFAHMTDTLANENTTEEIYAVATLMRDCGVAVNMSYGPSESSTLPQEARAALINFFGFSPNTSYAERNYFSATDWNALLRENIAANQPILYSGFGSGGHSFVCDGYKTDDYFHFNFGWGGFFDGWFLSNAVNPLPGYEYSSNQTAIVGIVPDATGNVILGKIQGTSTFVVDEPLEFYHMMGHNAYEGSYFNYACDNNIIFISSDDSKQLVADILEFEDQNVTIYDGPIGGELRTLTAGGENDLSPVVSTTDKLLLTYNGNLYPIGFHLVISQNSNCRMVSNILTSVDTTTIHLQWTENGTATQWEVEYGEEGFSIGNGVRRTLTSTSCDITELLKLTHYDIYVRSICGVDEYSSWHKVRVMTGAPYWQDIVTSTPETFVYDNENQTVYISCAEDFVWYTKGWCDYKAVFVSNIDLGGFKWKPVWFSSDNINIDGNNFVIKNLYINEISGQAAIFSHLNGNIKNLGIEDAHVKGGASLTGVLCAELNGNAHVTNCYITNSIVEGVDVVGGLIARNFGTISNCYANVSMFGNRWTGVLTGDSHGNISNCYAAGSIQLRSFCYYAGISAYAASGVISNCYSVDFPMGVVGYKGQTLISDTSSFYKNGEEWILRTPIAFEKGIENNLLNALNEIVKQLNDSSIRTWKADTQNENNGLPVFGNLYNVTCPNIQNLSVQNSIQNEQNCVIINWQEVGEANSWEIKYKKEGLPDDSSHILSVNNKPTILYNLSLGHEYIISVRSVFEDNHSGWVSVKEMVDLPFWTDVVIEQPAGFFEDTDGNVTISSAEGLTWLAILVNGFHGNNAKTYEGKTISLTADIDLQGYRWYPIGREWYANPDYYTCFKGTFRGNNHTISNLYVNCSEINLGLFGFAGNGASFSNIKLTNGIVNSYVCHTDFGNYGGLLGLGNDIKEIINCSSNVSVKGTMAVGSLCGWLSDNEGETTIISNCSASGDVYGRESTAGLIGEARGVIIQNCYATGNVHILEGNWNSWYRGGLIGNLMSNAVVRNCYSIGNVELEEMSNYLGKVIGCCYMNSITQNVYGLKDDILPLTDFSTDAISDTSSFIVSNGQQVLITPITLSGNIYNNLLDVLNAWVAKTNDPTLKTWVMDELGTNGGFPILGDNYTPTCYNPTNLHVTNATIKGDSIIRTRFEWEQEGSPLSWELMYVTPQQSLDSGIIIPISSNPCELTILPVGKILDLYVRAICEEDEKSDWSKPVRFIPDKLHWTEVVTSRPEGYQEDGNGNVFISSAEGLAWFASVMNELNGNSGSPIIKNVYLTSDIDLSEYRWTSINALYSTFEGNNHTINGLYCNEYADYQGLFGTIHGVVRNLNINNSTIAGLTQNGTIAGAVGGYIINCAVNGNISGVMWTGGLVGRANGLIVHVHNSLFVGKVIARQDLTLPNCYNGLIGGISGEQFDAEILNSYVASDFSYAPYSGHIAGVGTGVFNYVYALNDDSGLNLTYDNLETNSSFFTRSGTSWTLNTPPYIAGAFHTDLVDALNAWVDANNSEGKYRHWVADTEIVNGGFPIFDPQDNPNPTSIDHISQEPTANSQKLLKDGQIFILRGEKVYTVTGQEVK